MWTVRHTSEERNLLDTDPMGTLHSTRNPEGPFTVHGTQRNLPLFAEEDLLQDAHLSVPLGQLLCAVSSRGHQAASQHQGPWGCPGDPLFHGVVGKPTGHLKGVPVHHQLPFSSLAEVFDLVDVD